MTWASVTLMSLASAYTATKCSWIRFVSANRAHAASAVSSPSTVPHGCWFRPARKPKTSCSCASCASVISTPPNVAAGASELPHETSSARQSASAIGATNEVGNGESRATSLAESRAIWWLPPVARKPPNLHRRTPGVCHHPRTPSTRSFLRTGSLREPDPPRDRGADRRPCVHGVGRGGLAVVIFDVDIARFHQIATSDGRPYRDFR